MFSHVYFQLKHVNYWFQVVEDGYEFFSKRQLVTLFSAPNYCGEFDNAGAMMSVDETLMCSFQILKVTNNEKLILSLTFRSISLGWNLSLKCKLRDSLKASRGLRFIRYYYSPWKYDVKHRVPLRRKIYELNIFGDFFFTPPFVLRWWIMVPCTTVLKW